MGRIFKRGEEKDGLKYTTYLGDGDSKSCKFVSEADPQIYNIPMEKQPSIYIYVYDSFYLVSKYMNYCRSVLIKTKFQIFFKMMSEMV